jgi:hypothetical protein
VYSAPLPLVASAPLPLVASAPGPVGRPHEGQAVAFGGIGLWQLSQRAGIVRGRSNPRMRLPGRRVPSFWRPLDEALGAYVETLDGDPPPRLDPAGVRPR